MNPDGAPAEKDHTWLFSSTPCLIVRERDPHFTDEETEAQRGKVTSARLLVVSPSRVLAYWILILKAKDTPWPPLWRHVLGDLVQNLLGPVSKPGRALPQASVCEGFVCKPGGSCTSQLWG